MGASSQMEGFRVALDDVRMIGYGLSRPECVLCFASGDIFASHNPGSLSWIRPDGSVARIGDRTDIVPNGFAHLPDGSFLLANHRDDGGIYQLFPDGRAEPFVTEIDGAALPSVNFVYRDHQQRIWLCVSSPRPGDDQYRHNISDGYVAVIVNGKARMVADGFCWTNECRLDASGETFYVNETFGRQLTRFRVKPNGDLVERSVVTEFGRDTFPDGLALDEDGGLWVVAVGSNRVIRVAPDGRQQVVLEDSDAAHLRELADALESHRLTRPMLMNNRSQKLLNISSIAFAGPDRRTAVLGCLLGNSLATFRVPVAGLAPSHWQDRI
jgi:sugar lactone lactonase YvrE